MAVNIPPEEVADAFVKQYYHILNSCPEALHRFYNESSLLAWPKHDDVMEPVTTLKGINDKIMSSDYKNCLVEVKTVDAQASHNGGVIVAVAGSFIDKDEVTHNVSHTFFLATQERGFFVLNDILRVMPIPKVAANAPILESPAPGVISDSPTSCPTKAADESGNINEALDTSAPKDSCAEDYPPSFSASGEEVLPAVEPVSGEKVLPAVEPVSNGNVPSVVTRASNNVPPKITYASMVAKVTPPTTPKTTPKASAPLVNGAPKASTIDISVPKALASPSKVATKLPTGGNSAHNAVPHANDRGVYIGRLPFNVTKHGVAEALRKFGPVKRYSDAVQIRKYDDGFCCAFVEFESADSARRAVEAHHVKFGEKEAYIAYKKSSYNRGGSRSPTRGGFRNGTENRSDYETGRDRGSERSRSSDQGARAASRDRLN